MRIQSYAHDTHKTRLYQRSLAVKRRGSLLTRHYEHHDPVFQEITSIEPIDYILVAA